MNSIYVALYTPGPKYEAKKHFYEQEVFPQHGEYMKTLFTAGVIIMGGPFEEGNTFMVMLDVSGMNDAQRLTEGDPAVSSGVMAAEVREWHIALGAD